MSAVFPIQTNFSGGELSPRLQARVDSEKYRISVAELNNFYSLPQGSAFRRPGTEYIFPTLNNGPARLVQFGRGRERDYVAEFTDGFVRMYNRDGVVQNAGGEELVNPQFSQGSDGLFGWTTDSKLTALITEEPFIIDVMEFAAESPTFKVTQFSDEADLTNFVELSQEMTVEEDPLNPGTWLPHSLLTDYLFVGTNNNFQVQLLIGDGVTEDAYVDNFYAASGNVEVIFTPLVATVTVKYRFSLSILPTDAPNFVTIQNLSLKPQINDPLLLVSPFSGSQLAELDVAMDLGGDVTGRDRLWIVHPDVAPQLLTRVSANDWTLAAVVFTAPPAEWTAGNYPGAVELFSGRSWFSAVPNSRSQLWASKAGNYFDFTVGSNPGDSLDLQLVTRGAIQWIKGQKALLLGTDLAEHTITSSQSLAIPQVGDVDVREQSSNGSVPIEPTIVGNEVVYLNPDRTKVYASDYLRENDGWNSFDLTWGAEHITRAGVIRHTWVRDPNNQLMCVMDDGTIAQCIYDKRFETIAWNSYETDGNYISLCTTNDLSGSSQWHCIKRTINDVDNYYIETVQAGEVNNQYMDSWLLSATVDKVVTGLDHLEGETVQVLVNGAIEPDKVVTGGSITTEADGNAAVGLQYTGTLKTLRPEGGNPAGSSQLSSMDFYEVNLRLNDSAVPAVDGQRPPLRDPQTPMNTPTPLTTGDSETYQLNVGSKGQLTITQELPLRTEITAIYGKLGSDVI